VGVCGKAAACRTRVPLGLRTPGAWLPSLGLPHPLAALQAATTWRSVCPTLGAWAAYLCAGQTKRTCGAWADC